MVHLKFKTIEETKQAMQNGYVLTPTTDEFLIIPSDEYIPQFEGLIPTWEFYIKGRKDDQGNNFEYFPIYFYICHKDITTQVIREITKKLLSIDVKSQDEDSIYDFYPSIIGSAIFLITQLEISKESPIYLLTEDIINKILENIHMGLNPTLISSSLISYYKDLLKALHNYDITKTDCYNTYKTLFEDEDN